MTTRTTLTRNELTNAPRATKKCAACKEDVLIDATTCKHCGQPTSGLFHAGMAMMQLGVALMIIAAVWYFLF
jgi:predicted transposase YbfD/YdcC